MKPILLLISLVCAITSGGAVAETYKCVENGKLTISDQPCPSGTTSTVVPSEPGENASSKSAAEEMEWVKQKLETMQAERHAREADEVARKAEAEKTETQYNAAQQSKNSAVQQPQNSAAQRNAIMKKKKKRLEEEREALERRLEREAWERDSGGE